MSNVCSFYEDKVLFVTGCTGVLGTCLVEKILRCLNIKKLILMIRPKRGKSPDQRIKDYLNDIVFSRVDKHIFDDKIACVCGDLTLDTFGLATDDLLMIQNSVNIIFHVAATIRFDEPLSTALKVNLRATKILLDIATDCKSLESFVYVSTAYSNFGNKLVEEKLYKHKFTPELALNLLETYDDATVNKFASIMLEQYPNTYTFSKGLSEDLLEKYAKNISIGIIRPASIIPSYQEPFPGWINKGTASNVIILEAALGRIRVMRTSEGDVNVVPVDMCANAMLAIGWECFRNRSFQSRVYNFTSANLNLTDYIKFSLKNIEKNPSENTFYYPFVIRVQSDIQYKILAFMLHTLPAVILDTPSIILQRKLRTLIETQRSQDKLEIISSFLLRLDWIFKTDNVKNLWTSLNANEQKMFNFNLDAINWEEYLPVSFYGLKKFYLKEKMDEKSIEEAKNRYNRLRNIHLLMKYGLLPLFVFKLASKL